MKTTKKITNQELREITRNFVHGITEAKMLNEDRADPQGDLMTRELESRAKIIKGLEMAGIDASKLKDLPSSANHMKALLDMINQAIDTTIAGKGIAAQKKTARALKGLVQ